MRHFRTIAVAVLAALFLTLAPAHAGNKFKNEDTAKNRQDNVFGTDQAQGNTEITIEKNERGADVIRSKPTPKEEVDWYDKIDMNTDLEVQVEE